MRKCLVTGATGLIGSSLLPALQSDWDVFGVSRHKLQIGSASTDSNHLVIDLSKEWDVKKLPSKINAVIHLAQSEHFRDFPEGVDDIFQVNTTSTLRMLDYAYRAGAETFILASSGGVYGHIDQEFIEDVELPVRGDLGFYLSSKLCAEVLTESYTPYFNVIVLRFFFVYGPGQRKSMLIPRLVQSVLNSKPIILQGRDGFRFNPTYVSDAVAAICRCLDLNGSHKINIAGHEILSLRQTGETIGRVLDKKPKFSVQHDVEPRHLIGNIRKMHDLLVSPSVGFEDGVKKLINGS